MGGGALSQSHLQRLHGSASDKRSAQRSGVKQRGADNTLPEARTRGVPRWVGPMKSKRSTSLYTRDVNRPRHAPGEGATPGVSTAGPPGPSHPPQRKPPQATTASGIGQLGLWKSGSSGPRSQLDQNFGEENLCSSARARGKQYFLKARYRRVPTLCFERLWSRGVGLIRGVGCGMLWAVGYSRKIQNSRHVKIPRFGSKFCDFVQKVRYYVSVVSSL